MQPALLWYIYTRQLSHLKCINTIQWFLAYSQSYTAITIISLLRWHKWYGIHLPTQKMWVRSSVSGRSPWSEVMAAGTSLWQNTMDRGAQATIQRSWRVRHDYDSVQHLPVVHHYDHFNASSKENLTSTNSPPSPLAVLTLHLAECFQGLSMCHSKSFSLLQYFIHFLYKGHCTVLVCQILFIHCWQIFGLLPLLAMDNVAMNSHVQVFMWSCFNFPWVHICKWHCWII